jgi:hypothetical protein
MSGLLQDSVEPEAAEEVAVEEAKVEAAPVEDNKDMDTTKVSPEDSLPVDAPEKPEWLDEAYFDAKTGDIDAEGIVAKYNELKDSIEDKAGESVEDYATEEFYASEGMEGMSDDPAMNKALEAAKEAGLGVEQAHKFIKNFMEGMSEFQAPEIDTEAELKKLGKNGTQVVSGLKTWIDGMQRNGDITEEVHAEIVKLGSTAEGIKALDFLRQKTGETAIPTGQAITGEANMTKHDWYAATFESHGKTGETRDNYNDRMSKLGEQIFGNGRGTFNGSGLGV